MVLDIIEVAGDNDIKMCVSIKLNTIFCIISKRSFSICSFNLNSSYSYSWNLSTFGYSAIENDK